MRVFMVRRPCSWTCSTPPAVRRVVSEARPDAVIHQATALADVNFS